MVCEKSQGVDNSSYFLREAFSQSAVSIGGETLREVESGCVAQVGTEVFASYESKFTD